MLKRTLLLTLTIFAVAVPVAAAYQGPPPASIQQVGTSNGEPGQGASVAQARQVLQLLQRLRQTTAVFARRCASQQADVDKCTAAATRTLAALQRVDKRIDGLIAELQQRCEDTAGDSVAPGCASAEATVQSLRKLQSGVGQLEQKLQDWLDHAPSASSSGY